jgi:hypothetical protein
MLESSPECPVRIELRSLDPRSDTPLSHETVGGTDHAAIFGNIDIRDGTKDIEPAQSLLDMDMRGSTSGARVGSVDSVIIEILSPESTRDPLSDEVKNGNVPRFPGIRTCRKQRNPVASLYDRA